MSIVEKCGIYGIFCDNGKVLVGSSKQIGLRWTQHCYRARKNKHENPYFQYAFNKYGESSFELRMLEECPENMLINREDAWMEYLQSCNPLFGYNLQNARRTYISERTRKKLSISHFGIRPSKATRRKMSKSGEGRIVTKRTREKLRKFNLGKHHTEETIRKMIKAQEGVKNHNFGKHWKRPHAEETKRKIGKAQEGMKNHCFGKHWRVVYFKKGNVLVKKCVAK